MHDHGYVLAMSLQRFLARRESDVRKATGFAWEEGFFCETVIATNH